VFTLVFHCCLCHVGPQLKKHSAPAGFAIRVRPNPVPAGFEKIISGATLVAISVEVYFDLFYVSKSLINNVGHAAIAAAII